MDSLATQISDVFSISGTLSDRSGFEHRPQQGMMAEAVATALRARKHLIVEAPTGVGKTLAYLVPAILYALQEKRKAIVSTHTKNLQEQLLQKDIPIAKSLIGADISVATLKGRRNYLCTTRLENAIGSAPSMFDEEGRAQLEKIRNWSLRTKDGDIEGVGFTPRADVWDMVCSDQGVCSAGICTPQCFFQRAKLKAKEANLLIVNHALFFSLFVMSEGDDRFIFPDDFVIFDEAHTLEAVAGAGIGFRVSHRQAILALHKLFHPKAKKGLLASRRKKSAVLCEKAEASIDEFFATLGRAARALSSSPDSGHPPRHDVRIRTPQLVVNSLEEPLGALDSLVRDIEENTGDMFQRKEIATARAGLQEIKGGIDAFLEQSDQDLTYWIELPDSGNVTLCAAPSDVGGVLGPRLFRDNTSIIMTSASLSVNGSLDYFRTRIGALEAESLMLDSPFEHARQMTLCLSRDIPEPESELYARELPSWIMRSIDRSHGRALVLFTSVAMMRSAAAALYDELASRGMCLLVQGVDGQRHTLLERFKSDIDSVLFGLDSFWMGVDVPGEALEHVIITRLPFAVPNHPLIEARLETIAARGGSSFMEYTLPEAVLKFKQGAGRLIRTRDDRGMVTVLDSRIMRKSYGRAFISSLPACPIEILSAEGDVERIEPVEL